MAINDSLQFVPNQIAHWVRMIQDNTDPVFLNSENQGQTCGTCYGTDL